MKVIVILDGPDAGRFVERYDPDFADGRGMVDTTDDLSRAMRFPDAIEAWALWKLPSTVHPIRLSDGKPNRPMTAFSITVVDDTEEATLDARQWATMSPKV